MTCASKLRRVIAKPLLAQRLGISSEMAQVWTIDLIG
jgi:hypothetical protein